MSGAGGPRHHGYLCPVPISKSDGHGCLPANPTTLPYDGSQSPAADPASGRVSPESHAAIATISAWS